jgi:hypothetical protein
MRLAAILLVLLLVAAGLALLLTEGGEPDAPSAPPVRRSQDQPVARAPGLPGHTNDDHPENHRVTLEGVVFSGATGSPIPGATVRALGLGAESVCKSSSTGAWSLQCAAGDGGDHHLRIEHPRYVPRELEWTRWSGVETPVRIPPLFLLPVAAQIRGRVVGPDGESVPLAEVRVFHNVADGSSFSTESRGILRLNANEQGCFGPVPVPPGTVTVQANGIDLPDFGVSVIVAPGPIRTIEVEVVLPAPVFATGRVVDGEGHPLKATIVGWVREIETDPEGRFRVPLLPGEFARISARREGFLSTDLFRREALAGEEVRFELRPALELSGTVLEADGSPARAGLRVRCNLESALTDREGRFRLGLRPAGKCEIEVLEGHQIMQGEFSVVLDERTARDGVVLRLPEPIGFIDGLVLEAGSEKPLEGVEVGSQVTDEAGRFRISVAERGGGGWIESLGFRKDGYRFQRLNWGDEGEPVRIRLMRLGEVRVRAVDESGDPVAGAEIFDLSDVAPALGWTDQSGEATLTVPIGGAWFQAYHPIFGAGEAELTVEPGVVTDVSDIELKRTTTILITDENGVPLPDAWLRIPRFYNEIVQMADSAGVVRTLATRGFVTAPGREVIRLARDTHRDPGRTDEITFSLRPSTPATGRLVDRKGRPLPGQSIGGAPGGEVTTDGRGRFRIEGIPDGHPVDLTAELSAGIRVTAGVGGGDRDVVMQVPEMRRIRVRLIEAPPGIEGARDFTWVLYESLGHGVSLQVAKGTLPLSPEDQIVSLEGPPHADVLKVRCGPGTWRIYTGLHRQDTELEYDFPKSGKTVILVRDADRELIEGASIREAGTGAVLGKTNENGFWISEPDDRIPSGVLPLVVAAEGYVEEVIAARDLSTNAFEEVTLRKGGTVSVRIVGTSFARVFVLLRDNVSGEWNIDSSFIQFRRHLRPGRQQLLVCPEFRKPFVVPVKVKEGESTEVVIRVP